ncbi:MAG: hypothetical protein L6R39_004193 [Caloplaca ligustica]|nr:MAG: hypothetical protein L6R39_004193 [Caloplaca ligustica]
MSATTDPSSTEQITADIRDVSLTDTREVTATASQSSTGSESVNEADLYMQLIDIRDGLARSLEEKLAIYGEDSEDESVHHIRQELQEIGELLAEGESMAGLNPEQYEGMIQLQKLRAEQQAIEAKHAEDQMIHAKLKAEHQETKMILAKLKAEQRNHLAKLTELEAEQQATAPRIQQSKLDADWAQAQARKCGAVELKLESKIRECKAVLEVELVLQREEEEHEKRGRDLAERRVRHDERSAKAFGEDKDVNEPDTPEARESIEVEDEDADAVSAGSEDHDTKASSTLGKPWKDPSCGLRNPETEFAAWMEGMVVRYPPGFSTGT